MAPVASAGYKGHRCLNPPLRSWDSDSDSDQDPAQPPFSKRHSFPPGVGPPLPSLPSLFPCSTSFSPPGQPWNLTQWTLPAPKLGTCLHPDPQPWGPLDQAWLLPTLSSPQPEQPGLLSLKTLPERK